MRHWREQWRYLTSRYFPSCKIEKPPGLVFQPIESFCLQTGEFITVFINEALFIRWVIIRNNHGVGVSAACMLRCNLPKFHFNTLYYCLYVITFAWYVVWYFKFHVFYSVGGCNEFFRSVEYCITFAFIQQRGILSGTIIFLPFNTVNKLLISDCF